MLSLPICLISAEEQVACRCLRVRAGSPESASASAWFAVQGAVVGDAMRSERESR